MIERNIIIICSGIITFDKYQSETISNRKFSELSKSRKDLEKEFFRYFEHGSDGQKKRSSDGYWKFEEKVKSLDIQLFSIIKQMDSLRKEAHENKSKEQESIDLWIHWVMVELDTGIFASCLCNSGLVFLSKNK